ncbi:hypothetical protein BOTNAR_0633g00030 [Botryotinia narcissicola]|uniref:F-box domain-containing protein n=1 Tax=Botryotinia narcissicola TaxID=278944 RepID=A0A4Z1H9P5_9HELO|nr:hypothetical protein BOTNAR_0633g00030 [Botryotinia narcissicola]
MSSQGRTLHLLKFPTEILDNIFKHVLLEHPEWSIMISTPDGERIDMHYIDLKDKKVALISEARPQVQVLRTCKQIHSEYREVFWKNRSFTWNDPSKFVETVAFSRQNFFKDTINNITRLEHIIEFTRSDPHLATWFRALQKAKHEHDAFGRYTSTWKALKQVKLHLFGDGCGSPITRSFVYGIRSNRNGFMAPGDELDLIDCHRGFALILESLDGALDSIAFPHKIRRADGRVEKLTQILDLGLKWNDYSDAYHKKNWVTLTAILKACNAAFEGAEIWIDGVLCWKDNVEQACMKSIEDEPFRVKFRARSEGLINHTAKNAQGIKCKDEKSTKEKYSGNALKLESRDTYKVWILE